MSALARAIELEVAFQVWRSIRRKHARNFRDYPGNTSADRRAFLSSRMGAGR